MKKIQIFLNVRHGEPVIFYIDVIGQFTNLDLIYKIKVAVKEQKLIDQFNRAIELIGEINGKQIIKISLDEEQNKQAAI